MFDDEVYADLAELESAEEFLDYFGIFYDPSVIRVNRLHILQRFHDYVAKGMLPESESERFGYYAGLLRRAYGDFVESDARSEKVFKVFRMGEPQTTTIPVDSITVSS